MHFYQFNIGDYASHTRHLTPIEDIAYRRLLDIYYLHECLLSNCSATLARKINMREYEAEVKSVLEEFFQLTDGGYANLRADKEIAKYQQFIEAGKRGAAKRWAKANDKPDYIEPNGEAIAHPNATPMLNNKHKTINTKHNIDRPDDVSQSVWDDFLLHRKAKKATVTETVLSSIRKEATKAKWTMEDALKETCARNWQSFKADWVLKEVQSKPQALSGWK
jgi:uncharacterized protein YdaU (DUF1376 family)